MKGKIQDIRVSLRINQVPIDRAIKILQAGKGAGYDHLVDLIVYHVVKEREVDEA